MDSMTHQRPPPAQVSGPPDGRAAAAHIPNMTTLTHAVMAYSRGFSWVRALDSATGLALGTAPVERCQCRPGVQCVVGDRVVVEGGYVTGVAPRIRTLSRAVGPKQQLLAANVDRVLLVLAHGKALREGFLMRGLVSCTLQALPPVVVINKMDLDDGSTREQIQAWRALGIACVATSTVSGEGLEELRVAVSVGTSALMGHSGVGKSTLINMIRPDAQRKTGGVDWQGKGRHITTMAQAIVQPGSVLIDLPGIRELGLWEASAQDILNAFPDVAAAAAGCKFSGCAHDDAAVGCAVTAAVESGQLDGNRVALCERMRSSVALGTEGGGRI